MPIYTYKCLEHGSQDVLVRGFDTDLTYWCSTCRVKMVKIVTAPALINIERDWNEKANDYQHDPYIQAKAQLRNQDRAEQERNGARPMKITEEMIQVAAKGIHAGPKKGPSIVEKQLAIQKREKRGKVNGISSNASD